MTQKFVDPDWMYEPDEVLCHVKTAEWWHVRSRIVDIDEGRRWYRLSDATHTEYDEVSEAVAEDEYKRLEWSTTTKPASERGYRVNGVLCGPSKVDYWRGNECLHDYTCPICGEDGKGGIDVIQDFERELILLECRECGNSWEEQRTQEVRIV